MRFWNGIFPLLFALCASLHAANPDQGQAAPQSLSGPSQALPNLAEPSKASAAPVSADEFGGDAPQLRHSLSLHVGVGLRWFTQGDPYTLPLNGSTGTYGYGPYGNLFPTLDFSLGYQHPSGLGLEIGVSPSPFQQISVMPLYRYAMRGLGPRPLLQALGAQVGWAVENTDGSYYDNSASYYMNSGAIQMNTYALCYRAEQMLGARFSLGLELAYHYDVAQVRYTREPNAYYNGVTWVYPPATTFNALLNYSGPSVKISLGFWPVAPFWTDKDQARIDDALALREQRIEERLERIQARHSAALGSAYASATEAEAAGGRLMAQGNLTDAVGAYQEATLLAPGDSLAWRGLANAEYAQGKHARAYTHYKEALRLDPKDQELHDFVEKLGARLRQDLELN